MSATVAWIYVEDGEFQLTRDGAQLARAFKTRTGWVGTIAGFEHRFFATSWTKCIEAIDLKLSGRI